MLITIPCAVSNLIVMIYTLNSSSSVQISLCVLVSNLVVDDCHYAFANSYHYTNVVLKSYCADT